MRFEDDSVESAKIVKQWNVKIISVRLFPPQLLWYFHLNEFSATFGGT